MDADRVVDELTARQHGAVTGAQMIEAGLSRSVVEHRSRSGRIVRLHHDVYRLAAAPATWHSSLMGAVLAAGPAATVSHLSAGALWKLVPPTSALELTVGHARPRRVPGVTVHRSRSMRRSEITVVDRLPVTKPARTLIDLAAIIGGDVLGGALDSALSQRLVTCEYLHYRLRSVGTQGRTGTSALLELLRDRSDGRPRATSAFERLLLQVLDEFNVPRPRTQFRVVLPSGRVVYLDYAYPDDLVSLEADSYRYHADKTAWARDRTRNAELTAVGWRILPVTWHGLTTTPASVAHLVLTALEFELGRQIQK